MMDKADRLLRSGGIVESASLRPPPAAAAIPASSARLAGVNKAKGAVEIETARIEPDPDQPRKEFDPEPLERLAQSMRERGQLQAIRVHWDEARGRYIIICGERRWRAARMAGLATVSCVISDRGADAGELLADQLVENLLREDLRPIERARGFRELMTLRGWSGNQLARALGIAPSGVVQTLALLELPAGVQVRVESGAIPPSAAYEVSKLPTAEAQEEVAALVVAGGLSRAETIEAVRRRSGRRPSTRRRKITSKVVRTSNARVTIELRRGEGDAAIVAALREALELVERSAGTAAA